MATADFENVNGAFTDPGREGLERERVAHARASMAIITFCLQSRTT